MVEGKLREARADRRDGERERKMKEAVANMKQVFSGDPSKAASLFVFRQHRKDLPLVNRDRLGLVVPLHRQGFTLGLLVLRMSHMAPPGPPTVLHTEPPPPLAPKGCTGVLQSWLR